MNVQERASLRDRLARERLGLDGRQPQRPVKQWVRTVFCPVHKTPVPVKADGSLGAYCPKCLGEAASVLGRWGHKWRLRGFA